MTLTLPAGWRDAPEATKRELVRALRRKAEVVVPPPVWATPGALAKAINPKTVQTPALDVIDEALVWAHSTPDARLIISMPPQEGKSQRATMTSALWALTRNKDARIGIVSYSTDLAISFGRQVRNWIQDNQGVDNTLDLKLRIAPDNGSAAVWQLDGFNGGVICRGVGAGLSGRPIDTLIIDDPFADEEQASSETYREKVWRWWLSVGSTRLGPGAPVILIMTRWHEDDLAGRMLKADDGHLWRVVNIPAQADHDPDAGETDPLGRNPGEFMISARGRSEDQWMATKLRSGTRVWEALYQGTPSPDAGNVWKRSWWPRYTEPISHPSPTVPGARVVECDELIQSWDFTFKDTKSSDFVVGQVWARRGALVYLVDQVRDRMTFTDSVVAMNRVTAKWPQASLKLVEDKANGPAIIDTLRSKVGGIVPITPHDSKLARANAVSPYIEAGNVLLPSLELAPDLFDLEGFLAEAAAFPNGAHDDQVDATSQALARLYINGAQAWIDFMAHRVEEMKAAHAAAAEPEPLTPDDAREQARQAAFRASR